MASRRDCDVRSSKADTCDVLCNNFNKLRFKKASKNCFYEDYVLLKNQLLLLEYDEDDPSVPSKLFDVTDSLRRYIEAVPKHVQQTVEFVEDVHRKLCFLHESNCRHVKVNKQFPFSQELHSLLIRYVELEYEVLYCNYSPEYQKRVENRIISLLMIMLYDPTTHGGKEKLAKGVADTCAMHALYVMRFVKSEYKKQHSLVENIMIKLLRKLNVLDKVNEMRSRNKTLNLEKLLQVPQVQKIYEYLRRRDCASNDTNHSEDEVEEVVEVVEPVKKEMKYHIEEKINPSSFACYNVQRKVMTIDLDDEDEDSYMIYFQEEVPKLDKKDNKKVFDSFNVQNSSRTTSNISDRFDNYSQLNSFTTSSTCDNKTFNSRSVNSDTSVFVVHDDDSDSDIEVFYEENSTPIVDLEDDNFSSSVSTNNTTQQNSEQRLELSKEVDKQPQFTIHSSDIEDALLQCDDISDEEIENEDEILDRYNDDAEFDEADSNLLETPNEILFTDSNNVDINHSEKIPDNNEVTTVEMPITQNKDLVDTISTLHNDYSTNEVNVPIDIINVCDIPLPPDSPSQPQIHEGGFTTDLEHLTSSSNELTEKYSICDSQSSNQDIIEKQVTTDDQLDDSKSENETSEPCVPLPTTEDDLNLDNKNVIVEEASVTIGELTETVDVQQQIDEVAVENEDCSIRENNTTLPADLPSENIVTQACFTSADYVIEETVVTESIEQQDILDEDNTNNSKNNSDVTSKEFEFTNIVQNQDIPFEEEEVTVSNEQSESDTLIADSVPFNEEVEVPCVLNEDSKSDVSSVNEEIEAPCTPSHDSKPDENEQSESDTLIADSVPFNEEVEVPGVLNEDSKSEVPSVNEEVEATSTPSHDSKPDENEQSESDILIADSVPFNEEVEVPGVLNEDSKSEVPSVNEEVEATSTPSHDSKPDENEQSESDILIADSVPFNEEVEVPCVLNEDSKSEVPSVNEEDEAPCTPSHDSKPDENEQLKIQDHANDECLVFPNEIDKHIPAESNLNSEVVDSTAVEVTTSPNQTSGEDVEEVAAKGFTDTFASNNLDVLASVAAEQQKMEDAIQAKGKANKKKGKKGRKVAKKDAKNLEPLKIAESTVTRRVTRSSSVKKLEIGLPKGDKNETQEQCKCIPSTFMNLESLITPPPNRVYNLITDSVTDNEESLDELFNCLHSCENQQNLSEKRSHEIITKDAIFDEDTIEDGISLVSHRKQSSEGEVVISIPESEKDYPGINYDILKQAEEFEKTNLSLSTSDELCKELNLKRAKNDLAVAHDLFVKSTVVSDNLQVEMQIQKPATDLERENNLTTTTQDPVAEEVLKNKQTHAVENDNAVDSTEVLVDPNKTLPNSTGAVDVLKSCDTETPVRQQNSDEMESTTETNKNEEQTKTPDETETNVYANIPPKKNKRRTWFNKTTAPLVPVKKRKNYGKKNLIINKHDTVSEEKPDENKEVVSEKEQIEEQQKPAADSEVCLTTIEVKDSNQQSVVQEPAVSELEISNTINDHTEEISKVESLPQFSDSSDINSTIEESNKVSTEQKIDEHVDETQKEQPDIQMELVEEIQTQTCEPDTQPEESATVSETTEGFVEEPELAIEITGNKTLSEDMNQTVSQQTEKSDHLVNTDEILNTNSQLKTISEISKESVPIQEQEVTPTEVNVNVEQVLTDEEKISNEESIQTPEVCKTMEASPELNESEMFNNQDLQEMPVLEKEGVATESQIDELTEDNYPLLVAYEIEMVTEEVVDSSELQNLSEPQTNVEKPTTQVFNETPEKTEVTTNKEQTEKIKDKSDEPAKISSTAVTKNTTNDIRKGGPVRTKAALKAFQNPYVQLQKLPVDFDYNKSVETPPEDQVNKHRSKSQDSSHKQARQDHRSSSEAKHKRKQEDLVKPEQEKSTKPKENENLKRRSSADCTSEKEPKSKEEVYKTKTRSGLQRQKEKQVESTETPKLLRSSSESTINLKSVKPKPVETPTEEKPAKAKSKVNKDLPLFSVEDDSAKITYIDKRRKSVQEKEAAKSDQKVQPVKEETIKKLHEEEPKTAKNKSRGSSSRSSSRNEKKSPKHKLEEEDINKRRDSSSDLKVDSKKAEPTSTRRHSTRSRSSSRSINESKNQNELKQATPVDSKDVKEKSNKHEDLKDDMKLKHDKIKENLPQSSIKCDEDDKRSTDSKHRSSRRSSQSSKGTSQEAKSKNIEDIVQEHKKSTTEKSKVGSNSETCELRDDELLAQQTEKLLQSNVTESRSRKERRESIRTRSSRDKLPVKNTQQSEKEKLENRKLPDEKETTAKTKKSKESVEIIKSKPVEKIRTRSNSQHQDKSTKLDDKQTSQLEEEQDKTKPDPESTKRKNKEQLNSKQAKKEKLEAKSEKDLKTKAENTKTRTRSKSVSKELVSDLISASPKDVITEISDKNVKVKSNDQSQSKKEKSEAKSEGDLITKAENTKTRSRSKSVGKELVSDLISASPKDVITEIFEENVKAKSNDKSHSKKEKSEAKSEGDLITKAENTKTRSRSKSVGKELVSDLISVSPKDVITEISEENVKAKPNDKSHSKKEKSETKSERDLKTKPEYTKTRRRSKSVGKELVPDLILASPKDVIIEQSEVNVKAKSNDKSQSKREKSERDLKTNAEYIKTRQRSKSVGKELASDLIVASPKDVIIEQSDENVKAKSNDKSLSKKEKYERDLKIKAENTKTRQRSKSVGKELASDLILASQKDVFTEISNENVKAKSNDKSQSKKEKSEAKSEGHMKTRAENTKTRRRSKSAGKELVSDLILASPKDVIIEHSDENVKAKSNDKSQNMEHEKTKVDDRPSKIKSITESKTAAKDLKTKREKTKIQDDVPQIKEKRLKSASKEQSSDSESEIPLKQLSKNSKKGVEKLILKEGSQIEKTKSKVVEQPIRDLKEKEVEKVISKEDAQQLEKTESKVLEEKQSDIKLSVTLESSAKENCREDEIIKPNEETKTSKRSKKIKSVEQVSDNSKKDAKALNEEAALTKGAQVHEEKPNEPQPPIENSLKAFGENSEKDLKSKSARKEQTKIAEQQSEEIKSQLTEKEPSTELVTTELSQEPENKSRPQIVEKKNKSDNEDLHTSKKKKFSFEKAEKKGTRQQSKNKLDSGELKKPTKNLKTRSSHEKIEQKDDLPTNDENKTKFNKDVSPIEETVSKDSGNDRKTKLDKVFQIEETVSKNSGNKKTKLSKEVPQIEETVSKDFENDRKSKLDEEVPQIEETVTQDVGNDRKSELDREVSQIEETVSKNSENKKTKLGKEVSPIEEIVSKISGNNRKIKLNKDVLPIEEIVSKDSGNIRKTKLDKEVPQIEETVSKDSGNNRKSKLHKEVSQIEETISKDSGNDRKTKLDKAETVSKELPGSSRKNLKSKSLRDEQIAEQEKPQKEKKIKLAKEHLAETEILVPVTSKDGLKSKLDEKEMKNDTQQQVKSTVEHLEPKSLATTTDEVLSIPKENSEKLESKSKKDPQLEEKQQSESEHASPSIIEAENVKMKSQQEKATNEEITERKITKKQLSEVACVSETGSSKNKSSTKSKVGKHTKQKQDKGMIETQCTVVATDTCLENTEISRENLKNSKKVDDSILDKVNSTTINNSQIERLNSAVNDSSEDFQTIIDEKAQSNKDSDKIDEMEVPAAKEICSKQAVEEFLDKKIKSVCEQRPLEVVCSIEPGIKITEFFPDKSVELGIKMPEFLPEQPSDKSKDKSVEPVIKVADFSPVHTWDKPKDKSVELQVTEFLPEQPSDKSKEPGIKIAEFLPSDKSKDKSVEPGIEMIEFLPGKPSHKSKDTSVESGIKIAEYLPSDKSKDKSVEPEIKVAAVLPGRPSHKSKDRSVEPRIKIAEFLPSNKSKNKSVEPKIKVAAVLPGRPLDKSVEPGIKIAEFLPSDKSKDKSAEPEIKVTESLAGQPSGKSKNTSVEPGIKIADFLLSDKSKDMSVEPMIKVAAFLRGQPSDKSKDKSVEPEIKVTELLAGQPSGKSKNTSVEPGIKIADFLPSDKSVEPEFKVTAFLPGQSSEKSKDTSVEPGIKIAEFLPSDKSKDKSVEPEIKVTESLAGQPSGKSKNTSVEPGIKIADFLPSDKSLEPEIKVTAFLPGQSSDKSKDTSVEPGIKIAEFLPSDKSKEIEVTESLAGQPSGKSKNTSVEPGIKIADFLLSDKSKDMSVEPMIKVAAFLPGQLSDKSEDTSVEPEIKIAEFLPSYKSKDKSVEPEIKVTEILAGQPSGKSKNTSVEPGIKIADFLPSDKSLEPEIKVTAFLPGQSSDKSKDTSVEPGIKIAEFLPSDKSKEIKVTESLAGQPSGKSKNTSVEPGIKIADFLLSDKSKDMSVEPMIKVAAFLPGQPSDKSEDTSVEPGIKIAEFLPSDRSKDKSVEPEIKVTEILPGQPSDKSKDMSVEPIIKVPAFLPGQLSEKSKDISVEPGIEVTEILPGQPSGKSKNTSIEPGVKIADFLSSDKFKDKSVEPGIKSPEFLPEQPSDKSKDKSVEPKIKGTEFLSEQPSDKSKETSVELGIKIAEFLSSNKSKDISVEPGIKMTEFSPVQVSDKSKSKFTEVQKERLSQKRSLSEDTAHNLTKKKRRTFSISDLIADDCEIKPAASEFDTNVTDVSTVKTTTAEKPSETVSTVKKSEPTVIDNSVKKTKKSIYKQKFKKKDPRRIDSIIENLKSRNTQKEENLKKTKSILDKDTISSEFGDNAKTIDDSINDSFQKCIDSATKFQYSSRTVPDSSSKELSVVGDVPRIQEATKKVDDQIFAEAPLVEEKHVSMEVEDKQADAEVEELHTNKEPQKTIDNNCVTEKENTEQQTSTSILEDTIEQEVINNSLIDTAEETLNNSLINKAEVTAEPEIIDSSLIEESPSTSELDKHHMQKINMNPYFTEKENYELMLHENAHKSSEKYGDSCTRFVNKISHDFPSADSLKSDLQQIIPMSPTVLTETVESSHLLNDGICENIFPYGQEAQKIDDNCLLDSNIAFTETVEISLSNDGLNFKESSANNNKTKRTGTLSLPTSEMYSAKSNRHPIHDLTIPQSVAEINQIPIATSLAESTVQLLKPPSEEVIVTLTSSSAEASTSCETTDNLIAVIRSSKTGFLYFRGTDHNYHSVGDPLLGGECDTNESDRSSDTSKETPTPDVGNVFVDIATLSESNQEPSSSLNESSVDSSTDFQLLDLIGNTLVRESSPPLTQTISCDNLYKQEVLEYDDNSASNIEFSKENSEVYSNQYQQQTMSVENMSELMNDNDINFVLTSIQNLNKMATPIQNQDSSSRDSLFQPTKSSDFNIDTDGIQTIQANSGNADIQNLESNCNFVQVQETPNVYIQPESSNILFVNDVQETDFTSFYYLPINYETSASTSNKKVIVERIPQYPEQTPKSIIEMNSIPNMSTSMAGNPVATNVINVQSSHVSKQSQATPTTTKKTSPVFEAIPVGKIKQNESARTSSSLNLGFVRTSSRTRVSAPKPKKPSDRKHTDDRDSESNATDGSSSGNEAEVPVSRALKLKVRSDLGVSNTSKAPIQAFKIVPAKERSLYVIEDSNNVAVKKQEESNTDLKRLSTKSTVEDKHKQSRPKDVNINIESAHKLDHQKQGSRTPKQVTSTPSRESPTVEQKSVESSSNTNVKNAESKVSEDTSELVGHSDMIDNVKRRKRKPVDYSSIEKLLENDEYESMRLTQKAKHKKEENDEIFGKSRGKLKSKSKMCKPSGETEKAKNSSNNCELPETVTDGPSKSKDSIFEDSDDDIPKKKKSKPEGRLEPETMNAQFDKLVKEGNINNAFKGNGGKSEREANGYENIKPDVPQLNKAPTSSAHTIPTSSIFHIDTGLQKKSDTVTPVKQIGVVNPIPRPSNNVRKEPPCSTRNSYSGTEEGRGSSQYYPYYPERSRRSYPYSSRESSRSSHQSSSRRVEYPSHSSDPRYSSQRSSSSRSSRSSSRHHSTSRSSTEQRSSYRYTSSSASDLAWLEDMKKKMPHMFKDQPLF